MMFAMAEAYHERLRRRRTARATREAPRRALVAGSGTAERVDTMKLSMPELKDADVVAAWKGSASSTALSAVVNV